MGIARNALLRFFRRVSAIYFRETEVVGAVPTADTKGRIFAANHVNGLVDPILVLTNAPCAASPIAKSTLWKVPVLKWLLDAVDAVPVVRRRDDPNKPAEANDEIFDRVASHLSGGGNILIFPEGTSHNEPHLVKLKSGAARMLARAHAGGARGLSFQAVGLEFEARDTFRSRALVVYGPVRAVDDLGASGDDLAKAITDMLREDLSELIVEGADWEERELIARVNMTDIQAAIGLVQLKRLESLQARRREIVAQYNAAFSQLDELQTPTERPEAQSALHLYVLRLNLDKLKIDRARFIEELKTRNIGSSVHFIPVHIHPFYRNKYGWKPEDFPVAYGQYQREVSLPLHPGLTAEDVADVIAAVTDIVKSNRGA